MTESRWKLITAWKHPIMAGHEHDLELALVEPAHIRRSRSDAQVNLYYRHVGKYWLCVVVKNENGTGFIITAYFTDKIKEGQTLWPR
ncbi:MAG: DUF4258 domain-containing protein [Elusimicrobia bacterium]|nr:DUF4258 domain-containing protein [Elusimicrobiota bacterium]